jgi:molecular chaperone GrpE
MTEANRNPQEEDLRDPAEAPEPGTPEDPTESVSGTAGAQEHTGGPVGAAPGEQGEPLPPDEAADEADQAPDEAAPEAEEDPIARAERERDDYLDALRRERAEFENFRKRTTRERMDALDRGAEQLAANLIGVLDSFGYALDAAGKSSDDQLAKGVQMVHAQLMETLRASGLEEVEGAGAAFDPNMHEAMLQVDASEVLGHEVDDAVVVEVLRPGWRFKGRILRPASVKVAR